MDKSLKLSRNLRVSSLGHLSKSRLNSHSCITEPLWKDLSKVTLLLKVANEPVPQISMGSGFYYCCFTVPKKDQGLHPLMFLRTLNGFIQYRKFRLTTLQHILTILQKGVWVMMLDLQDTYFNLAHILYLQFAVGGNQFQYSVLFRLSVAQCLFSQMIVMVVAYVSLQGLMLFLYIDNWLMVGEPAKHLQTTLLQCKGL